MFCQNKFLSLHAQICLSVMESKYLIPVNGLAPGKTEFCWSVGKEFFEEFGNTEVLDADFIVRAEAEKSEGCVRIDCRAEGTVTVSCDRCLSDLVIGIEPHISLNVRHEGSEVADTDDEREEIILGEDEAFLDMAQIIYDYACLSLPMHRVHADRECDSSVADLIGGGEPVRTEEDKTGESPFAVLKGMFDKMN